MGYLSDLLTYVVNFELVNWELNEVIVSVVKLITGITLSGYSMLPMDNF